MAANHRNHKRNQQKIPGQFTLNPLEEQINKAKPTFERFKKINIKQTTSQVNAKRSNPTSIIINSQKPS